MSISGLVLTTDGCPEGQRFLRQWLAADSRFDVGCSSGAKLPVTLETSSRTETHALLETLKDLRGVLEVTLAFAYFNDESEHGPDRNLQELNEEVVRS